MRIPFVKMHGLGNDYVYFDGFRQTFPGDPVKLAAGLSDRHFGIGGDGIVLILPPPNPTEADAQMRMFNNDGSEAEMCGNAIRCVGKYLYDQGHVPRSTVRVLTGRGVLTLELRLSHGVATHARVDMGEPILAGPRIPVALAGEPIRGAKITVDGRTLPFTAVSMGNPHAVFFVPEITDELVLGLGPKIEVHPLFPRKINVEFVRPRSRTEIDMRVWERGSGETMACGTGACAVAVAAVLNDLTERQVTIHLRGGDLEIEWRASDNRVFMTGPATIAFTGEVEV